MEQERRDRFIEKIEDNMFTIKPPESTKRRERFLDDGTGFKIVKKKEEIDE